MVTILSHPSVLTHWGRVTHICDANLTIIGSDNGLSPGRRQAIIWTNVGILLIGPLGTNFSEILIENNTFSFRKMHLKMSSVKWWPFVSASMCKYSQVSLQHNHIWQGIHFGNTSGKNIDQQTALCTDKPHTRAWHLQKKIDLPNFQNSAFFQSAYIDYRKKKTLL